ncbi:MAG TPA: universal stress protein [Candidatus Angelobacter sp.]
MPNRRHSTFNKILVGYDGSAQAKKALEVAFSLARVMDSKILVFAVARPPEPATSVEVHAVLDDAREHYEEDFKRISQMAAENEITVETQIAVGHPAEQIIHRAEQETIDLVVLGRRGTSLFEKWILGSVSERVLRYAHCPVMVVR